MSIRISRSMVTFSHPFTLSGYSDELAPGDYEVAVEEELLQGLSFEAYRKTATYLTVHRKGNRTCCTEMREITGRDLEIALSRDRAFTEDINRPEATLSPLENLK
jgi:hypothetical protein